MINELWVKSGRDLGDPGTGAVVPRTRTATSQDHVLVLGTKFYVLGALPLVPGSIFGPRNEGCGS
jgi:hypothetical protein